MIFPRTKHITLANNKGGVGKTTLTYNIGKWLAQHGYKVGLIDLDPQCNLSRLALGDAFFETTLFDSSNIFSVLKGVIDGGADVDHTIQLESIENNLFLLRGSLYLSQYESILSSSFAEAASGQSRGYFVTSAIDRYLRKKGLEQDFDLFLIDTNPSLGQLNKTIFLGSDYLIVPTMPDAFNYQGLQNLGTFLETERRTWNITAKALARDQTIPSGNVLQWEPTFVGYIVNSYNRYAERPIKAHQHWIDLIPQQVKIYLSEKHSRNGLVALSHESPLGKIQDYGQLPSRSQEQKKAIFEFTSEDIHELGTQENIARSQIEFQELCNEVVSRLTRW